MKRWLLLCLFLQGLALVVREQIPREEERGRTPAQLLAPVLLGGFKGLTVDLLWLRAVQLQERGEFFELPFLYDLIADLSPELEEAWEYNSFNMIYNLPSFAATPEDRWQWVRRGLRLIERGRERNPRSIELAFWHCYVIWHLRERDRLSVGLQSPDHFARSFLLDGGINPEHKSCSEVAWEIAWQLAQKDGHPVKTGVVLLGAARDEVTDALAEGDKKHAAGWLLRASRAERHIARQHPAEVESFRALIDELIELAGKL